MASLPVAKTLASAPDRSYKAGLKEGEAKGMEAGLREGKLETARQMKADGMSVQSIAKYTGLTSDELAAGMRNFRVR